MSPTGSAPSAHSASSESGEADSSDPVDWTPVDGQADGHESHRTRSCRSASRRVITLTPRLRETLRHRNELREGGRHGTTDDADDAAASSNSFAFVRLMDWCVGLSWASSQIRRAFTLHTFTTPINNTPQQCTLNIHPSATTAACRIHRCWCPLRHCHRGASHCDWMEVAVLVAARHRRRDPDTLRPHHRRRTRCAV